MEFETDSVMAHIPSSISTDKFMIGKCKVRERTAMEIAERERRIQRYSWRAQVGMPIFDDTPA